MQPLFAFLRQLPAAEAGETAVHVTLSGASLPARVVAVRKSAPATEVARRRILREADRKGKSRTRAPWNVPPRFSSSPPRRQELARTYIYGTLLGALLLYEFTATAQAFAARGLPLIEPGELQRLAGASSAAGGAV